MVAVEVQVLTAEKHPLYLYLVLAFSPVTWSLICLSVNPSLAVLGSLHIFGQVPNYAYPRRVFARVKPEKASQHMLMI